MNRCLFSAERRLLVGIVLMALLSGCISVPTGTTRVYKNHKGANGTVTFDDTLFTQSIKNMPTIRKAPAGPDKSGADVFAVYLSDGYFKYLKDMAGVNEVVVVAEFTETSAGEESDTVTRVLGPYFGVADNANTPFMNKLLYGPKTLDSDHLNMKLTVIEYDQGENENSAAFLDFIQSVSQTLSLANPVTAAEQAFAKEIAKSLLRLNKDDVVMEIDINFTADAGELKKQTVNGSYIPLSVGDYVLINKEHCAPANCYFQMSDKEEPYNVFAWIGDAVLLVPTAMRRAWTDTPDRASLKDIDGEALDGIRFQNQQLLNSKDGKLTPYTDKTWLALSIVKGGDASLWQKRKLLSQAERSIQGLIKVRGGELALGQNYQLAKQALEDAYKVEALSSSGLAFVQPVDGNGAFLPTTSTAEYCLYHARTLTDVAATFYRLDANKVPQQLAATDIVKNTAKTTPNNTCFTVNSPARALGTYDMVAAYKVGKEVLTQKVRYTIDK